jgi:CRISPR type III-B/RAMP module-associated protein Cmr3
MRLTPREPYFFGNEKTFHFPGALVADKQKRYYITGERIPTQTTIIGTLRYILLPVKNESWKYTVDDQKKNGEAVGYQSFQYGKENSFGKIKGVSPVFILKGDERLIVTPFDHTVKVNDIDTTRYTPFADYKPLGLNAAKMYPIAFNAKDGIANSYLNVDAKVQEGDDGTVKQLYAPQDIFRLDTRVGINRDASQDGFFKRDYVAMKQGFSFGVYVELDDDLTPTDSVAYMGQGKSLFTVSFEKVDDGEAASFYGKIAGFLQDDIVYCLSDVFVENSVYESTSFAVTDTRDYRAYVTNEGRVAKGSKLYKLIRAGSIFKTEGDEGYKQLKEMIADKNVEIIGYNHIVSKKENYNENSIL